MTDAERRDKLTLELKVLMTYWRMSHQPDELEAYRAQRFECARDLEKLMKENGLS